MIDYFLAISGGILIIVAFIGCFVPIVPGPPLAFGGLLCVHYTRWGGYSVKELVGIGIAVLVAVILDYVLPLWGTKKFGGSKRAVTGATIGMLIGAIFLAPWGIIVGPFVGAFIGEYSKKENRSNALYSAFGTFVGIILSLGIKIAAVGITAYYYITKLLRA